MGTFLLVLALIFLLFGFVTTAKWLLIFALILFVAGMFTGGYFNGYRGGRRW